MASVSFKGIEKSFGKFKIIHGISFDIADGEFMVLALAPGAYGGGFGMRLGFVAVVAHDGAQPLASHPMELG